MRKRLSSWYPEPSARHPLQKVAIGFLASVLACVVLSPAREFLTLANVALILVLVVMLAAVKVGRGAAVASALGGTLGFAYVFLPPHFSLWITELRYALTAIIMLAVALITGQLTSNLKQAAEAARRKEARAHLLYEAAGDLAGATTLPQAIAIAREKLKRDFDLDLAVLVDPDAGAATAAGIPADLAMQVVDSGDAATTGDMLCLPLLAPTRTRGVAAVSPLTNDELADDELRQMLATLMSLLGIAIERIHYVEAAQAFSLHAESERLRNSLLTALSHDVRTPLAGLVATADALALSPPLTELQHGLAMSIRDQGMRVSGMVTKLLDMARLQSGAVVLRKRPHDIRQAIDNVLASLAAILAGIEVAVEVSPNLPGVDFDALLIERVLHNLLENAAKQAPVATHIAIGAGGSDGDLVVTVTDDGPGVPPPIRDHLFEKFVHGETPERTAGIGLGLAICHGIIAAHGGRIWHEPVAPCGTRFGFVLPANLPAAP